MMTDVLIEGIRMMVILTGFFSLVGECFLERKQKQRILTIVLVMACALLRVIPFSDLIARFIYEMELLVLYILVCYKKERWLHLMYMSIVYVAVDIAYVLMAVVTRWLTDVFPKESYQFLRNVTILILYVILIFVYPKVMRWLRHWIGNITSMFFV